MADIAAGVLRLEGSVGAVGSWNGQFLLVVGNVRVGTWFGGGVNAAWQDIRLLLLGRLAPLFRRPIRQRLPLQLMLPFALELVARSLAAFQALVARVEQLLLLLRNLLKAKRFRLLHRQLRHEAHHLAQIYVIDVVTQWSSLCFSKQKKGSVNVNLSVVFTYLSRDIFDFVLQLIDFLRQVESVSFSVVYLRLKTS